MGEEDAKKAETYKVGVLQYRIYETGAGTWRGYIRWGGKPWIAHRATKAAVEAACTKHGEGLSEGVVNTEFALDDAQDINQAMRELAPFGVSLTDAARYYVARHKGVEIGITVDKAVKEFLEKKKQDNFSPVYLHYLRVRLNGFSEHFCSSKLIDLGAPAIDDWLRTAGGSARSRNNRRSVLITFFNWARDSKKYLPYGQPVAPEGASKARNDTTEIGVISPETLKKYLDAVDQNEHLSLYLRFGAHTGIRTAELLRLDWSSVDLRAGQLELGASITKTASRRLVPIHPKFKAWLRTKKQDSGPIIQVKRLDCVLREVFKNEKLEWIHNCLRHSYISYRVAEINDVAKVALEAGNSPQKIFSNYRSIKLPDGRLITKTLAAKWFSTI